MVVRANTSALRRATIIAVAACAYSSTAIAKSAHSAASVVGAVLAVPDTELDYARAKLAFDRIIDPTADVPPLSSELDHLTKAANDLAGSNADEHRKLAAVRQVIYEPGAWNDNRPFIYDPKDPLGRNPHHKLLVDYLTTRQGNCISMPILFLILADRMGLKGVALANAPLHDFVRYTDTTGRTFNIETTSGGHVSRDEWYRQQMPMTDRSVESGIYLRSLTRREAVADMATTVIDYLLSEKRFGDAIEVSEVILRNYPHDTYAMVKEGTAYAGLIDQEYAKRYPTSDLIPPSLLPRYQMLNQRNQELFDAAEALGWQPTE